MGRIKGYTNKKLTDENKRKKELCDLEKFLIRDRQFFSNLTNEEYIEYELSRVEGLTRNFLIKFLKKYGYISTNSGSIRIDNRDFVIRIYRAKIDETMRYCG